MSEEIRIYEDAANVSVAEVEAFEANIEAFRAAVEETAAFALGDAVVTAAGYKIVDLRGAFTSRNGSWGTSVKNLGHVLHYNGPETPAWAFSDPVAWIKMINGLHDDVGRFAPGWWFDGFAYHEMFAEGTVYWVREFAAKLPHCGNGEWNAGGLAGYIPVGGGQRPSALTLRTAFARIGDHLKAMNMKRDRLVPHSAVGQSECCGNVLRSEIRSFIGGGSPGGTSPAPKPSDPKPTPTPATSYRILASGKQQGVFGVKRNAVNLVSKLMDSHDDVRVERSGK